MVVACVATVVKYKPWGNLGEFLACFIMTLTINTEFLCHKDAGIIDSLQTEFVALLPLEKIPTHGKAMALIGRALHFVKQS